MPSSQKSIFIARLGNVAGLTLAEEAKPIARNKCIESVAQWMRQNAEAGSIVRGVKSLLALAVALTSADR